MVQKYVLVEHLSNINSIIKAPLQLTQRIKFTCFDVSQNFIVLGATSGGLYVFNRFPPVFINLIPNKEGAVSQVAIAPNEKTIALATVKGLVVVIENCFTESNVIYKVYREHEGNSITAIKWLLNEVYCGDNKGNISVILLPNLLTKAIFQTPSALLMRLDSNIVQIDCYKKLLLISTNTRTYICNTDKEQYRQIGKKLRDGCFGACFFNGNDEPINSYPSTSSRLFKNADDEQFSTNEGVKIFCMRPGARMWEAKLDSSVTRTHQFKSSLSCKPTSLLQFDDDILARLKITHFEKGAVQFLNFSKVFLLGKFIFTFNTNEFYLFHADSMAVLCWCRHFAIKDVKIIENFVYIWNDKLEINVVALYDLEKVIIKSLIEKQYFITGELCVLYAQDVLELIETSDRIHLISVLKDKLKELDALELLEELSMIFRAIQDFSENKNVSRKLASGIVVVNNAFDLKPSAEKLLLPETFQTLTDKLTVGTKNLKEKLQILEVTVKNLTSTDSTLYVNKAEPILNYTNDLEFEDDEIVTNIIEPLEEPEDTPVNVDLKLFRQQYELTKINFNLEIPKFKTLLLSNSSNRVLELFMDFKEEMKESNIEAWCYRNYLKYLSDTDNIQNFDNEDILSYASEAFRFINFSLKNSCGCLFPLPTARINVPAYYDVGCNILNKLRDKTELFHQFYKEVPYMWRCIIKEWKSEDDIDLLLPLLVQYGDQEVLRSFVNKFKYDTWDDAVKLLIKLNQNVCLNCDNNLNESCDVISWSTFSKLMVQSIGGPSTINLLIRYANYIPSTKLNVDFYQTCIFASAGDNFQDGLRHKAINLAEKIQSKHGSALQFDKVVGKFLEERSEKCSNVKKTDLKCSFCDLPVDIPLINSCIKLKCNHLFHLICLKYNGDLCSLCKE